MASRKKAKMTVLSFPPDMVEEILLRLDSQTLLQCRSVCKDWRDVISSSHFIRSHSSHSPSCSTNQILLVKVINPWHVVRYPYCNLTCSLHLDNHQLHTLQTFKSHTIHDFKGVRVIGACNGLICLSRIELPSNTFILWNLTLRKYAPLPVCMNWGVNISKIEGFGFDSKNNDFKVMNFVYSYPEATIMNLDVFDYSAWVFSYLTWSWKRIKLNTHGHDICSLDIDSPSVFFNGVLHCAVKRLSTSKTRALLT